MQDLIKSIYNEKDTATLASCFVGAIFFLISYLLFRDIWVSSPMCVIGFTLAKIIVGHVLIPHLQNKHKSHNELQKLNKLSDSEKISISLFVENGSCSIPVKMARNCMEGIYSLEARELLRTSMSPDGVSETFVLDERIFELANENKEIIGCVPF